VRATRRLGGGQCRAVEFLPATCFSTCCLCRRHEPFSDAWADVRDILQTTPRFDAQLTTGSRTLFSLSRTYRAPCRLRQHARRARWTAARLHSDVVRVTRWRVFRAGIFLLTLGLAGCRDSWRTKDMIFIRHSARGASFGAGSTAGSVYATIPTATWVTQHVLAAWRNILTTPRRRAVMIPPSHKHSSTLRVVGWLYMDARPAYPTHLCAMLR